MREACPCVPHLEGDVLVERGEDLSLRESVRPCGERVLLRLLGRGRVEGVDQDGDEKLCGDEEEV